MHSIRLYQPTDALRLATIYRDAVHQLGGAAYTLEQLKIWASFAADHQAFAERLAAGQTWIAEHRGHAAAFVQLHPADHIALLYCAPDYAGRGLATALLKEVEREALVFGSRRLTTEASHIARPVFLQSGYQVDELERVERQGLTFERFRMSKLLRPSAAG